MKPNGSSQLYIGRHSRVGNPGIANSLVGALCAVLTLVMTGCGIELSTEPWQPPPKPAVAQAAKPREACKLSVPERQPLFGDLHIHTALSMDANAQGTRTTPDDVYAFATGEEINLFGEQAGDPVQKIRIDRPLDFAAVTDHAEWLGEVSLCTNPQSASYQSEGCAIYRGEQQSTLAQIMGAEKFRARLFGLIGFEGRKDDVCGADDSLCRAALKSVWQDIQQAAERWYDRSEDCRFTTFHGWEYSHSPKATKVHRNIILRNEIVPELPISSLETPVEMDLRKQLLAQCNDSGSGCDAIAIPHNPNLSNGQMFRVEYADLPLDEQREEAALRARLEPIVEMMQIKGESECRNGMYNVLGAQDELCEFEKIRDFGQPELEDCELGSSHGAQKGKGCTSRTDYVRYALLEGLKEKQRIGINPYAFGFIGSTDTHTSAPGSVSEIGRPYKYGYSTEQLLTAGDTPRSVPFQNPGGLAGVWAEENNRDSIFNALKRRETFATSGPRIVPRFFGGWDLPDTLCENPAMVSEAYRLGVPMGGTLSTASVSEQSPSFLVAAAADFGSETAPGTALQRLQVIKGWVGDGGEFHQQVFDVAGDPDNGASVDLDTCQPEGQGYAQLCTVWRDPAFDHKMDAVYYARVVENPSCRWTTRQCLALPEAERPDACRHARIPKTIQERAWTSPIWYGANE